MSSRAATLFTGLIAGLALAVFLQVLLPAPSVLASLSGAADGGSTQPDGPLFPFDTVADMLRNSLQIAGRAVRGEAYKSFRPAASAPSATSSLRKSFSSTANMASEKSFLQAIKDRRTIYALNKTAPVPDSKIVDTVKQVVLHVPSSFNSQSARLVVLLNDEHDKFWDFVKDVLKPMVPEDQWSHTEQRVSGFRGGYGTVLFFEDPEPVSALQKAFPIYAHHFPDWSEHTSAMHQYALWVALEAEGFGANLQHYNPIIDRKAQEEWNIPLDWKLRAQLVFGGKVQDAGDKEFKPVEGERLFVHGAKKE